MTGHHHSIDEAARNVQSAILNAISDASSWPLFWAVRPRIFQDGNQWCCLYGESIQSGVCGFGVSPNLAFMDFVKSWHEPLKNPQPINDTTLVVSNHILQEWMKVIHSMSRDWEGNPSIEDVLQGLTLESAAEYLVSAQNGQPDNNVLKMITDTYLSHIYECICEDPQHG